MPATNEVDLTIPDPADDTCLRRTRSAVLNVLVVVGMMIAVSGWLLRRRAEQVLNPPRRGLHDALLIALFAVGISSYLVRRISRIRPGRVDDVQWRSRFFWSHVAAAAIAALAVPLGLAYGWWVDPRLQGVIPFWVVPLALGFLAMPRRGELDDGHPSTTQPGTPSI
jgi:hypothetical protein